MAVALPPIDEQAFEQHASEQVTQRAQTDLAALDAAHAAQQQAEQAAALDVQQRAQAQIAEIDRVGQDAAEAQAVTQRARAQVDAITQPAGGAFPRAPAGGVPAGVAPSLETGSGLGRVYADARAAGLDEEGARAAVAVAATEGGMTGTQGDTAIGGSRGTFQLYFGGGQGNNYARARGISEAQADAELARDPHAANQWALGGYLGQAIRQGQAMGLRGPELATYAQRYGQVSVSPERAGANYQSAQAALGGTPDERTVATSFPGVEAPSAAFQPRLASTGAFSPVSDAGALEGDRPPSEFEPPSQFPASPFERRVPEVTGPVTVAGATVPTAPTLPTVAPPEAPWVPPRQVGLEDVGFPGELRPEYERVSAGRPGPMDVLAATDVPNRVGFALAHAALTGQDPAAAILETAREGGRAPTGEDILAAAGVPESDARRIAGRAVDFAADYRNVLPGLVGGGRISAGRQLVAEPLGAAVGGEAGGEIGERIGGPTGRAIGEQVGGIAGAGLAGVRYQAVAESPGAQRLGIVPSGGWPSERRAFDAMNVDVRQRPGWGQLVTRTGEAVTPDTDLIVYHATDRATAERLLAEGVVPESKPMNLARRRFEAGEPAEYAPGRGVSGDLYVGGTPGDVSGYGPVTLAIRVRAGDLRPSPEQVALGSARVPADPFESLRVGDAVIAGPITPDRIAQVGEPRARVQDAFAELRRPPEAAGAPPRPPVEPPTATAEAPEPVPEPPRPPPPPAAERLGVTPGESGLLDAQGRPIRPPKGDIAPILDELGDVLKEVRVRAPRGEITRPEFLQPEAKMPTQAVPLLRQVFDRTRNVIGSMGEAGEDLAGRVHAAREGAETDAAAALQRMPGVDKLGKADFENMVDVLEGNAKPRSIQVERAAAEAKGVLDDIFSRAENAGVDVAERINNYFPHRYKQSIVDRLRDTNKRAEAIRHLMTTGQADTEAEAIDKLSRFATASRSRRHGSLEMERLANLPGYEKTKEALYSHVLSASRRINEVAQFGRDDAIKDRLITQMTAEGYDGQLANDLFKTIVGAKTYSQAAEDLSRVARTYQTATRLGLAAIGNATQPVTNTMPVVGVLRTLRGMAGAAFSPEERRFADLTGVTLDQVIRELREGGGWSDRVLPKFVAGFGAVEKWNRRLTVIAGRDFARDMAERATRGSSSAARALKTMGLDVDAVVKRGGQLTPEEEIRAARNVDERVNFRVDPQDLPQWTSHPIGRMVAQFKQFPMNQSAFVKRELIDEAMRGNVLPITRFAILAPLAYAAATETRNVLQGREPEEDPRMRLIQYALGPLGTVGDVSRSLLGINSKYVPIERRVAQLTGSLGGPTVGMATEALGAGLNLGEALFRTETPSGEERTPEQRWAQVTPAVRLALRQIPYVGTLAQNVFAPYKQRDASARPGRPDTSRRDSSRPDTSRRDTRR